MSEQLELYDYRRRVFAMYRERNEALLSGTDPAAVLQHFRATRDDIFAHHSQTALDAEQLQTFTGLDYFPYNPDLCCIAEVDTTVEPVEYTIAMNATEVMTMTTVAHLSFEVEHTPVSLALYWLDIYGGGLFLPFRDTTCPAESYGGGRYLFDTIKGSDFVSIAGETGWQHITLDFNYAYNPSCAYNDAWVCPLAPIESRLLVPIRAGEKKFDE